FFFSLFSLFFFSLFFLPPLADTVENWPPTIEINCYRSILGGTRQKQPQSAVPPSSGQSAYRSAGGLVHTA
ncbi:hypothetical protein BHE74_00052201, partial [Ensete ventricosum]